MIVGLFPQLTGAGGIQRSGCLTGFAMASFAAQRGEKYHFLGLNDSAGDGSLGTGSLQIRFTGCGGSKEPRTISFAAFWHGVRLGKFPTCNGAWAAPIRITSQNIAMVANSVFVVLSLAPVSSAALYACQRRPPNHRPRRSRLSRATCHRSALARSWHSIPQQPSEQTAQIGPR